MGESGPSALNGKSSQKQRSPWVLFLYFASGTTALIYELVWSRMMMQVFGSTALAVGTVLAAFMAGMAIGSWLIGRAADKSNNCLLLYAKLEIGIALAALLSHGLLSHIDPVHLWLHDWLGVSAAGFALLRFSLAFVLVMIPTVLMGATMPVLARYLVNNPGLVGINLSTLYATNTFGAVTGVLLTGFFLIGHFGLHIPVYMAAAGNLLIGCLAWVLSMKTLASAPSATDLPEPDDELQPSEAVTNTLTIRLVLIALGISGFTSFAYEIYWTRSLVFVLGNSTYALTTMLSAFLTGIALGGYLVRFVLRRFSDRISVFAWVQILLGVFSAMALPLLFTISDPQALNEFVVQHTDRIAVLVFSSFGVSFLVMLVPAMLIGSTFPLVGDVCIKRLQKTGESVGKVYAINTVGNVLGALLPGVFLISFFGIQKGILFLAILNISVGFILLVRQLITLHKPGYWRLALPAAAALVVFLLSTTPVEFQFPSEGEKPHFQTQYYREGPLATTKVYIDPLNREKHMSVDGIVIGGTGFAEYKQLLLAHFPKMLLDDVSNELSVGLGSGILVGESALHPGVASITSVEIEPSVIEGAEYFANENLGVLENSVLSVVSDDIGNFLRTTNYQYQVVTADEKTADEYASNGFSYSTDYYQLLSRHLAPGGLVAQWVPATLPPRQLKLVLKTFAESFTHMQLWYFLPAYKRGPFNAVLIGSNEKLELDYDQINARFDANRDAFKSLVPYGLTSADALLSHYIADKATILAAVGDTPVNSLDHPRYEFFYPWDYAINRNGKIIQNHAFLRELKQSALQAFLADVDAGTREKARLKQTLIAEEAYLLGFQQFLTGMSLPEMYQTFDGALAQAPWNDSLRARIYAQYMHVALSSGSAVERQRLMDRARTLYLKK